MEDQTSEIVYSAQADCNKALALRRIQDFMADTDIFTVLHSHQGHASVAASSHTMATKLESFSPVLAQMRCIGISRYL
jgi:hypothetical protein